MSIETDSQERGVFSEHSGITPIESLREDDNNVASTSRAEPDETAPLLPSNKKVKKHWYRARPLWLVPFAISISISRGMTLAPRVEVFTQLACERLYFNHTASIVPPSLLGLPSYSDAQYLYSTTTNDSTSEPRLGNQEDDDPPLGSLPSKRCIQDPRVQAGAARIQTVLSTTAGLLSAITTGAWGRFGERHGRTKVLSVAVAGLLFTDIMFVLVSSNFLPLGGHRYALLLLAPVIEGLLGGYSTGQATTTAYLSDCTSDGSRARIFSRFHGVFFVGIAVGPEVGALLIRYSKATTLVFITSACLAATNLFLSIFVFPESLNAARREQLRQQRLSIATETNARKGWLSYPISLFTPLAVFLPRKRENRLGLDWNFPFLAGAMFCYLLSVGMYQSKYLYATHTYTWGAEELSYYITLMGTSRAFHLLLVLPYIIRSFKTPCTPEMRASTEYPAILAREMRFDLTVAKISLTLDILSHSLVTLFDASRMNAFVAASSLTSLGGGALPSMQSLALCISQVHGDQGGIGVLFGAIGFLQAVGSMIIGPLIFGLVFSQTVALFPKAIFVVASVLLTISIVLLTLIRPNRRLIAILRERDEQNRGRPRNSKALRTM